MASSQAGDISSPLDRRGQPWRREELEILVAGVRRGQTSGDLARDHGRTQGAILSASKALLPPEARRVTGTAAFRQLALCLAQDPDYDWRGWRQKNKQRSGVTKQQRRPVTRDVLVPTQSDAIRKGAPLRVKTSSPKHRALVSPSVENERPLPESADLGLVLTEAVSEIARERDREVLMGRLGLHGGDITLAGLALPLGMTRERVRQIQERALTRLSRQAIYTGTASESLRHLVTQILTSSTAEGQADRLDQLLDTTFPQSRHVAATALLRVVGFTRSQASMMRQLMDDRRKMRMAKEAVERRTIAARDRADVSIRRWLSDSDWPTRPGVAPLLSGLRRSREVGESDTSGSFASTKLGRHVYFESTLEEQVFRILESSSLVTYYQEQPGVVHYEFDGRRRRYHPDALFVTSSGRTVLAEIKPLWESALSVNRVKAEAARSEAERRGWGWLVICGTTTSRALHARELDAKKRAALVDELTRRGYLTWPDIKRLNASIGVTSFDIAAFAVQQDVRLQLKPFRLTNQG